MNVCATEYTVQSKILATTALVTVGIGSLLSLSRMLSVSRIGAGRVGWQALSLALLALHLYEIAWTFSQFMAVPLILWVAQSSILAAMLVASLVSQTRWGECLPPNYSMGIDSLRSYVAI